MRNPIYATSIGLIKYVAGLDDIYRVAKGKAPATGKVIPLQSKVAKQPAIIEEPVYENETYADEDHYEESLVGKLKRWFNNLFE